MGYALDALVAEIEAFELPPAGHMWDVPQVPSEPSADDVRDAVERLIALEEIAADIPRRLRDLDELTSAFSLRVTVTPSYDSLEMSRRYEGWLDVARTARDAWLEFLGLINQQIAHWQSAVAVMEHDIAWQQQAAGTYRSRPLPARALAIAHEAWIR